MKQLLLLAIVAFASCKKEVSKPKEEHVKAEYQVLGIGADTAFSTVMYGRTTPPKLVAEDDYLKIEMAGYSNGQYMILITNKQNCDADFQLSYEVVKPTAITPNRKNSLTVNQVKARKTETFLITAPAVIGKLKIKALTTCTWSCDPDWLTVDLLGSAMPVTFTSSKLEYNEKDGSVLISWNVEDTEEANRYIIRKRDNGSSDWYIIATIKADPDRKYYSALIWENQ